jgi:hypothetical protein
VNLHIDVLGRLHTVWGTFGVLAGVSFGILAFGLNGAIAEFAGFEHPGQAAVSVFVLFASIQVVAGVAMIAIGAALNRRKKSGRFVALVAAILNLIVVPFGTALGIYTFWVLLNDDARREFGRPPRASFA